MAPVINMVRMPVLLLSGILLLMTIAPRWLWWGTATFRRESS
jgi:ABC-2 type transport system permease protein